MKWLLALLLLATTAQAVPLRLQVLAPSTNDDNKNCGLVETDSGWVWLPDSGSVLTDLKEIVVKGKRFADTDTTTFPPVPAIGREGTWIDIDLDIPDGSMGTVWTYARDMSGNLSCKGAEYLYVIPKLPPAPTQIGTGLLGRHYTYDRWNDFKVFLGERVDTTINFDFGAGSAWLGGPVDYYSIRYEGKLNVPYPGSWTLYVEHKDGERLWISQVQLQDRWADMTEETTSTLWLPADKLDIKLEYYAGYGSASKLKLYWSGPNTPKQIIPKGALEPNAP